MHTHVPVFIVPFVDPTPTPTPTSSPPGASADAVNALPNWLVVTLVLLVALLIVGMFALTLFNLSAPRSTLKNLLGLGPLRGQKPGETPLKQLSDAGYKDTGGLLEHLGMAARVGKRTTRTTLALTGFSLLGLMVVAVFALSGPGVRDLRAQVVASVTTLVAAIAGFYFGSDSARAANSAPPGLPVPTAPTLALNPNESGLTFTVGTPGTYAPVVAGNPAPTVSLDPATPLPAGLSLNSATGVISGTPTAAGIGQHQVTLLANNSVHPIATLTLTLTVVA